MVQVRVAQSVGLGKEVGKKIQSSNPGSLMELKVGLKRKTGKDGEKIDLVASENKLKLDGFSDIPKAAEVAMQPR